MNEKPHRHKPDREPHETSSTTSQNNSHSGVTPGTSFTHKETLRWSLWRIVVRQANRRGAKVTDVLDAAEDHGIDRFRAAETLMFWLDRGDIRKAAADNRIVPQRGRWMP